MRVNLPTLLCLVSCVSTQPAGTKTKAPALRQLGAMARPTHRGEPLLTLAGGSLPSPVVVPLWFEPAASSLDELEKCSLSDEAYGSVFVGERDPYCGGESCRILDRATSEFVVPEGGCIASALLQEGCAIKVDYAGLPMQSYLLVEGKLSAQ